MLNIAQAQDTSLLSRLFSGHNKSKNKNLLWMNSSASVCLKSFTTVGTNKNELTVPELRRFLYIQTDLVVKEKDPEERVRQVTDGCWQQRVRIKRYL